MWTKRQLFGPLNLATEEQDGSYDKFFLCTAVRSITHAFETHIRDMNET